MSVDRKRAFLPNELPNANLAGLARGVAFSSSLPSPSGRGAGGEG